MRRLALCFLLIVLASPALGVDGVLEINQAQALAGGVTASDTAGFPVTLDAPGSYVLTSGLNTSSGSQTGIEITADDVTLDLNGFEIRGAISCSTTGAASEITCGVGLGEGISALAPVANVTVRNGSVRGFGQRCVELLGERAQIENVRVAECGFDAVKTGASANVRNVSATLGHQVGIWVGDRSRVEGCSVTVNRSSGVLLSVGSLAMGTVSSGNGGFAFNGINATYLNNTMIGNEAGGIVANDRATVIGNTILDNGQSGLSCQGSGVCNVIDNLIANHSLRQVHFGVPGAYRGNVLSGTTPVSGAGGVQTGPNYCNGSLCP